MPPRQIAMDFLLCKQIPRATGPTMYISSQICDWFLTLMWVYCINININVLGIRIIDPWDILTP